MSIVAGVDFGTLSVRVSVVDSTKGRLGSGVAEYPLNRRKNDPDHATQSHDAHMDALVQATHRAIEAAGVDGHHVEAIALDTTGSSVIPVGEGLVPLDDYYLWCDHRAWREAARITEVAHQTGLDAIHWCGDVYSSEWGWAKLLHWLRNNPDKRPRFVTALEHCDMVAAVLTGVTDPARIPRSICAMGHKWLWNEALGGLPPESFLAAVDPLLAGVRDKIAGVYQTSDRRAGSLTPSWAGRLGLSAGIPIPVGAFDAHWDAVGAGVRLGDIVNVIGTSTCIIAVGDKAACIPGLCGVVPGSVIPTLTGIEAGLSATGDIFDAIARRAQTTVAALSEGLERYRAGETGLLRLTWDNGDRTVLVNPELGGVTLGWNLSHSPQDDLFAAIEGTAFHTRIILERMEQHGVPIRRVINGGGIPRKNTTLNAVYANVLNKPILVPRTEVTSLGSSIFAFLAAGTFATIEDAQDALCPAFDVIEPDPKQAAVCEQLFSLYRRLYFGFGRQTSEAIHVGDVLPALRRIAAEVRQA
ncbi:MAG TPA: ribulokinase [Vicinamibacterales bacterium]|jgi:L-ribulokinase